MLLCPLMEATGIAIAAIRQNLIVLIIKSAVNKLLFRQMRLYLPMVVIGTAMMDTKLLTIIISIKLAVRHNKYEKFYY